MTKQQASRRERESEFQVYIDDTILESKWRELLNQQMCM